MTKMHELLAVETTVAGNYNRDLVETLHVLGKPAAFQKVTTTKTFMNDADSNLNEQNVVDITTTIPNRLKWFGNLASKYFDVQYQKDSTNQKAKADIILEDGTVLAKDVPATTLLLLETKLGQDLRRVFDAIPTLDSSVEWEYDKNESLYRTKRPIVTFATKKVFVPLVLAPATDKHPAQVKEGYEDRPVAKIERETLSGMISSAEKADLIERLDKVLAAVKKARQRANMTDVVNESSTLGSSLMNYITNLGGK